MIVIVIVIVDIQDMLDVISVVDPGYTKTRGQMLSEMNRSGCLIFFEALPFAKISYLCYIFYLKDKDDPGEGRPC